MYNIPLRYAAECLKTWNRVFPDLHDQDYPIRLKIAINLGITDDIVRRNVLIGNTKQTKYSEYIFNVVYNLSIESRELFDMVALYPTLLSHLDEFDGKEVYAEIYDFVRRRLNLDEFIVECNYTFEWSQ